MDDAPNGRRTLFRIAEALGVPVEALNCHHEEVTLPSSTEIQTLLSAFVGLTDPQARRRVINAAQTEAKRAGVRIEQRT